MVPYWILDGETQGPTFRVKVARFALFPHIILITVVVCYVVIPDIRVLMLTKEGAQQKARAKTSRAGSLRSAAPGDVAKPTPFRQHLGKSSGISLPSSGRVINVLATAIM